MELEDLYCNPRMSLTIACPVVGDGRPGRPSVVISEQQITTLLDLGFNYTSMAAMFGVSERTLFRRRTELGLQTGRHYSDISDDNLDTVVRSLVQVRFYETKGNILNAFFLSQESVNSGLSMIRGGLQARGIIVQRRRVADSLHRVDPLSQIIRRRITTYRRRYSVPTPNSLWYANLINRYYE